MGVRADGIVYKDPRSRLMTNEKMLAAAKKAARRMARATGTPYQTCLDIIAQKAGRDHWGAYLADPVDITPRVDTVPEAISTGGNDKALAAFSIRNQLQVIKQPIEEAEDQDESGSARPTFASRMLRRVLGIEKKIVQRSQEKRVLMPAKAIKHGATGIPLGTSLDNRYTLQLGESLPVLAMAPPGSGKTAGLIIPTILSCDTDTLVIHDERDATDITSGYRAQLGPVTVLNLAGPRSIGSLNPLSSDWMPAEKSTRHAYVQSLVEAITQDRDDAYVLEKSIHDLSGASGGTSFSQLAEYLLEDGRPAYTRAHKALSAFLEPGTVDCTTRDGFKPQDLRGVHDGVSFKPATLYILRNDACSGRQGVVAATIQSAIWWWALNSRPGDKAPDGSRLGPYSTTIILDDIHRLPYMPGLTYALDHGRAKRVAHIVTTYGYSWISKATKLDFHEIDALFAMQVILPQNDPATINHLMRRLHGVGRDELLASKGKHLLALQYESEPLRAVTPFYFTDPKMLAKAYDPRTGKGPKSLLK